MKFVFLSLVFIFSTVAKSGDLPVEVSSRVSGLGLNYITEYKKKTFFKDIVNSIEGKKNFFDLILKKSQQVIPETAVYLTKKTLLDTDSLYDLGSPWMINAPLSNGKHLTMECMIIMNGKVIFGYPVESVVKVDKYPLLTNKIKYMKSITIKLNGRTYLHEVALPGPLISKLTGFIYERGSIVMLYEILFIPFKKFFEPHPIVPRKLQSKSPFSRSSFY